MEPAKGALSNGIAEARPRILIVRLSAMGDVIHALPAVAALRCAFPNAFLGWVIEQRWVELLCALSEPRSGPRSPRRPLVDRVHVVNTKLWRRRLLSREIWTEVMASIRDLRQPGYDVAIDFQGAFRSAVVARWSGAPTVYGFVEPCENVASLFYTRQINAVGTHVIEQNTSLASALAGQTLAVQNAKFPCDENGERAIKRLLDDKRLNQFAILNPGAGWGAKRWPVGRYGAVAKRLAQVKELRSIVNFGPGEESLARAVEDACDAAAVTVSVSVTELIMLTRRASLFIGGDTGPMHLAAALGVPVVGIFGPTSPERNGPFKTRSIVLRSQLSPTTHARIQTPDEGMLTIMPEDVVAASLQLLGE